MPFRERDLGKVELVLEEIGRNGEADSSGFFSKLASGGARVKDDGANDVRVDETANPGEALVFRALWVHGSRPTPRHSTVGQKNQKDKPLAPMNLEKARTFHSSRQEFAVKINRFFPL